MPKLTTFPTLVEAWRTTLAHVGPLSGAVWPAALACLVVSVAAGFAWRFDLPVLSFLLSLGALGAWALVAVPWHRYLVLGERPAGAFAAPFAIRRQHIGYLLAIMMLGAVLLPGLLLAGLGGLMGGQFGGWGGRAMALVALGGEAAGLVFFVRLLPALPAVALGQVSDTGMILRLTRGHFWPLMGIICVAAGLVMLALTLLGLALTPVPLAVPLLFPPVLLFASLFGGALLSIIYFDLANEQD